MPRPLIGERPMTPAERQARHKLALTDRIAELEDAIRRMIAAPTIRDARAIGEVIIEYPAGSRRRSHATGVAAQRR